MVVIIFLTKGNPHFLNFMLQYKQKGLDVKQMNQYEDKNPVFYDYEKRTTPGSMSSTHFHSYHELYYLEKGKTVHFVGDQIYLLNEGDMVFVPSGIFHRTDNKDTDIVERHLFFYYEDYIHEEFVPYIEELRKNNYIKLPSEHIHRITDITRKMSYELKHQHADFATMQKLYLEQLLILICRLRITDTKPRTNPLHQVIQEIVSYISTNICADLSLPTLSAKYNISPSHLSKQFKGLTGMGLIEYVNIARVCAAEKLLLGTGMSITEVAMSCGFNDSNYFARVFKKLKGVTPKKYSMQK